MTDLRTIANRYQWAMDMPSVGPRAPVKAIHDFHATVARAYAKLPRVEPAARACWDALGSEVDIQFGFLLANGMAFDRFGSDDDDPYGVRSDRMAEDVRKGHLWVFDGGADHPIWTHEQNWRFRAVHDVFGHAMHGYSFGPNGEESAYRCHRQMFGTLAREALATETRGQNSWVNSGPYAHLPARDRPFATQKAALLPWWASMIY